MLDAKATIFVSNPSQDGVNDSIIGSISIRSSLRSCMKPLFPLIDSANTPFKVYLLVALMFDIYFPL